MKSENRQYSGRIAQHAATSGIIPLILRGNPEAPNADSPWTATRVLRKHPKLLCLSSILLALCSCAHLGGTEEASSLDDLPGTSGKTSMSPFQHSAESLANEVLKGITDENYKMFSQNMTYELKTTISQDKFKILIKRFHDELGDYASRQYLGELKQGPFQIALWKAKFSKTSNDVLLRLLIGELDGKPKIFGFWLQ